MSPYPTLGTVLDWTLLRMGYGVAVQNGLTLMLECACYCKHELEKKRAYEKRINDIEHSSFSPLVLASTGGIGPAAPSTYKRLATLLAAKWDQPYSKTLSWLRCRLSFSLLRSSIQASSFFAMKSAHLPINLMIVESQVSTEPCSSSQPSLILSDFLHMHACSFLIIYVSLKKIKI